LAKVAGKKQFQLKNGDYLNISGMTTVPEPVKKSWLEIIRG